MITIPKGSSPMVKARDFDSRYCRFKSCLPCHYPDGSSPAYLRARGHDGALLQLEERLV